MKCIGLIQSLCFLCVVTFLLVIPFAIYIPWGLRLDREVISFDRLEVYLEGKTCDLKPYYRIDEVYNTDKREKSTNEWNTFLISISHTIFGNQTRVYLDSCLSSVEVEYFREYRNAFSDPFLENFYLISLIITIILYIILFAVIIFTKKYWDQPIINENGEVDMRSLSERELEEASPEDQRRIRETVYSESSDGSPNGSDGMVSVPL